MPSWLRLIIAVAMAVAILWVGLAVFRNLGGARAARKEEPENVEGLEVFFVCKECGTELRVTRLGEIQVPRHCGEVMSVLRRQ
jgi:hypothetical protein